MLVGVCNQDVVFCRCKEAITSGPLNCRKLLRSNVLCIDFLGCHMEKASLKVQLRKHVDGIKVRFDKSPRRPHIHKHTNLCDSCIA